MSKTKKDIEIAWGDFIVDFGGQFAVTLIYNNHRSGTASPCYRVNSDGECLKLRGSGVVAQYGLNRLSGARYVPTEQIHRDLDRLHGRVDRKLFGCRFHLLPDSQRTAFVGFIEHLRSNLHVHLSWRIPDTRTDEFNDVVSRAWSATGPAATIDVQPIISTGWGHYIVKDQRGASLDDAALFVSSRPARS